MQKSRASSSPPVRTASPAAPTSHAAEAGEGLRRRFQGKKGGSANKALFDGTGVLHDLFRKLETSGKPWVSAINGTCMGGAFELSLACHGRVAANSEKVRSACLK
jgi:enoyl-CoA hydratase/carnithine racemase